MPPRKPSIGEDLSDKPRWLRDLPHMTDQDRRNLIEWRRNQLRSVRQVDDTVGEMLDLLARRGGLKNTYVVFTSDNGTQMGEHRWRFYRGAKSTAYEEAANVPMHVRGPGVAKGSNPSLVLNNDLAPTFLRMAGLTPPSYTDGRDLADVWKGVNLVRKAILNERALTDDSPMPPYRSVITGRYTYVEWESGEREFYDRSSDPYELDNAFDPKGSPTLASRLLALAGCAGEGCRAAEDAR